MTQQQYLNNWLKWHKSYELRAYNIFRNMLKSVYGKIPIGNLNYETAKFIIPSNISLNVNTIENAYIKVYSEVGLIHGRRIGYGINRDIKDFSNPLFSDEFLKNILDWVRENAGQRIVSVSETMSKRIIDLVLYSKTQNLSIEEMQRFIRKEINNPNFTRYQALRIARTETTTSANHAALESGKSSGILMQKQWISAQNERTRDGNPEEWNHLIMNGKQVGQNDVFVMKSNKGVTNEMLYPGDVSGSSGNIINCRCTVALVPVRDSDGFVVRI